MQAAVCPGSAFPLSQDILYIICANLGTYPSPSSYYAKAALVARNWTAPAQAGLYKRMIRIYVGDTDYMPGIRLRSRFARTMDTSPHLRVLLRSLSIVADGPPTTEDESCLGWLHLIPPRTLHRFEYRCHDPGYSVLRLMSAPAVQTVRSLSVHGVQSMEELKASLVPGIEDLFVETGRYFDGDLDQCSLPPKLRHLNISCPFHWRPVLYKLFIALSPQLDSFSTDGPWYASGDFHPWMECTLARYGRGLKRLCLTNENGGAQSQITRPFLDELVSHATRLEHLRVFAGAYTERLFRRLPATVKVLEFVGDQEPIPFENALLECISRAGRKTIALARIVVFSCEFLGVGKPEVYAHVAEACAANGVQYEYVGYEC